MKKKHKYYIGKEKLRLKITKKDDKRDKIEQNKMKKQKKIKKTKK